MAQQRPIRVLLAKSGLDGHDRGIKVISQGLREEGMEVIYIGLRQSPEKIVNAALQEGVDVIGLSSLSGGYRNFFPEVVKLTREKGMDDVLIIGGGIIPEKDMQFLIIGGDAAGMSAASRAKRKKPETDVTVLEQTGDVSYSA